METYGNDSKNIKMTRGDSGKISVNGLTLVQGDTLHFTIKDHVHSQNKRLQKIITSFTVEGNAIIDILPEDTKTMEYKNYVYDIQLTRANGNISTVLKPHDFKIESEVTFE